MVQRRWALGLVLSVAAVGGGCATAASRGPLTPPVITWEQKLEWMMRLEDQRIIRDPAPAPPPAVLVPATRTSPAIVAPPPPSDLVRLLGDGEARVRRRAALALGRVGLPEAVDPLTTVLMDEEAEVRQMAAFALGLIGDARARPALLAALRDAEPLVQGRAAEALGRLGDRQDAAAIVEMARPHAPALAGVAADDLTYPQAPPVEAARLALYALVRLGDYGAIASLVVDPSGRPLTAWWPVAYALQRPGDARATPALLSLLATDGRYTRAFAARGLGAVKAADALPPLLEIVRQGTGDRAVVVQAVRALAALGDASAVPVLQPLALDAGADPALRDEALAAFSALVPAGAVDLLLDLLSDAAPAVRAAATRALARLDPETFVATLSGLDADREWSVRAAQASALGTLPVELGGARLRLMLGDADPRVLTAVLDALVASKVPGLERQLLDLLAAPDLAVRARVVAALGELRVPAAVPALTRLARTKDARGSYVVRGAALTALTRIDAAAARPLLQETLADDEWALRLRAQTLLRESGVPEAMAQRPAAAGRPLTRAELDQLVAPRFSPHAFIETARGTIEIELAVLDAPATVANFVGLARTRFFDGLSVHRVVADFVVQGGDPRGDGEGSAGYTIRDEINQRPYLRGTVGMALDWADTGGSQFFITHSPQPHLDGRYTVFGHVVDGLPVVDALRPGDVIQRVRIWDGVTLD